MRFHRLNRRVLWAGLIVAVALLWLTFRPYRPSRSDTQAPEHESAASSAHQAELTPVLAEVQRLRTQVNALVEDNRALSEAARATKPVPQEPEETPEMTPQQQKEQMDAQLALLESVMATESDDSRAADELQRAFTDKELADVRSTIDCRTTLCRVQFDVSSSTDIDDVAPRAIIGKIPWKNQAFTMFNRETKSGVVYLTRGDRALPVPSRGELAANAQAHEP